MLFFVRTECPSVDEIRIIIVVFCIKMSYPCPNLNYRFVVKNIKLNSQVLVPNCKLEIIIYLNRLTFLAQAVTPSG